MSPPSPSTPVAETDITVRSPELDSFGHVNHAVFLNYFEHARFLALEEAGFAAPRVYVGSWSEWIRDPDRPVAVREPLLQHGTASAVDEFSLRFAVPNFATGPPPNPKNPGAPPTYVLEHSLYLSCKSLICDRFLFGKTVLPCDRRTPSMAKD